MYGIDLSSVQWRKSSRSDNNGGSCVEVAVMPAFVAVRDSKNPAGGHLMVNRAMWTRFVELTQHTHG